MSAAPWPELPLKRLLRPVSPGAVAIKGSLADLDESEGYPAYSASGQDVRVEVPQFSTDGIVLSAVGAQCGKCFHARGAWSVVANTQPFLPTEKADARFMFYVVNQSNFWEIGGSAQPYVQVPRTLPKPVPAPPLETQKRIAAFLDEKTARIDALIAKKQALLERLAEKRQAIITQAVTKGLNAQAPMKDSGIDWLGQIPAHWEALPLRRIADRVVTGRTPPSAAGDFFTDGEVPWFTPGDFDGLFLRGAEKSLTWDAFSEGHAVRFPANSVLLVGIGATLGKVAVAPVECSSNQQINAITVSADTAPVFLAYFLHAFRSEVRMSASGNTLPILNQDKTKSIVVTRPPFAEQVEIANSLQERDREIERVATTIHRSIELLRESRAALVTSAVIGQIEGLQ